MDYACVGLISLWKLGHFLNLLYWRLHHYDESPNKLCSRALEGAALLQSATSSSALFCEAGVLVGSESGSASDHIYLPYQQLSIS